MNQARILIVEDEAIIVRDIRQVLATLGYAAVADTPRGEEAIDLAGQLRPDLVLMDIHLAGVMDGVVAAQAIRERFALPVVFLTAFAGDEMLDRAKLAEPFGYIVKPFDERELRTVIEMALYKHKVEAALRRSYEEQAVLLRSALDGFWLVDRQGRFLDVNEAYCRMTGYSREEILQKSIGDFEFDETPAEIAAQIARIVAAGALRFERRQRRKDGRFIHVELSVNHLPVGEGRLFCLVRDVTERKLLEEEREVKVRLLALADGLGDQRELMQAVQLLLRDSFGCEAVGIRLKQGDDYPYFETRGFPPEFVRAESRLCQLDASGKTVRDRDGQAVLECMCGHVLCGRVDPAKSFFTAHGSFWTNSTTELLAGTTEADRPTRTRNRCHGEGYESMALVPLRLGGVTLGLLQLNDRRRDRFSAEQIGVVERLADTLAIVLAERQAREATRRSEQKFRSYLEHAPLGVLVIDRAGRYVEVNPASARILGYTEAELLQLGVEDLQALQTEAAGARRRARLHEEGSFDEVAHLRRKDGTEFWANLVAVKLSEDRFMAFVQDITARQQAEATLRESEERYRTLVELSPEAIIVHAAGRVVFANQAAARLAGAETAEALLGVNVMDFVQPESREVVARRIDKMATVGGVSPLMRQKWRRLDGTPIEVEVVANALQFGGRPATLVIALDVTAHRQAEAELRKLSRAVTQSPVTVVITDTTGAIEYVNPSFTATCGYTFEEARGMNPRLLQSGELPAEVYRDLWSTINAGREWRGEFHNRKKNGELFWEAATISPIVDETGTVTHFLAVKEDITERKVAEGRLREQAALLEVTQDAILVLDLDRIVTFWNRGAETLYGVERKQAVGRRYETIVYQEAPANLDEAWRQFMERGAWSIERRQVSVSRGAITVQLRATLVRDESGRAKSALIVITDITESKKMEAQFLRAQRFDSLGALASGVAHDLNNVLTPILMAVELLRPLARAKGDDDMLQLLSDSARRGADIVQQLLLFGRGSDAPRAPMNAAGVIKEVGQMMRQTFPKNLVLVIQAPADLWLIEADRTQLHQVILNLCVNARDAMPHGGRLAVTAENQHVDEALARNNGGRDAGPYVRIEVRDSGFGIPGAHLEKIFDPFFTTKPIGEGTGLGLATVLGIVRGHGGFLTVSSQENVGTVFEVFLPAGKSVVAEALPPEARAALSGRGECVLVVEDEEAIRGLLQRLLTGENYQVLVATDGAEALGVYSQNAERVKLIVTDMMMPTMDGTQMMTALRRMKPGLPVVAISGLPANRADFERKFAPRVRFLPKPFPSDLALRLVREALDEVYGPAGGTAS